MSDDPLRDELAATLHERGCDQGGCPGVCLEDADALLPVVRRHIEQARAEQVRPLMPAEHMVYTVARNQIRRGDNPPLNTTAGLLMTVERLAGIEQEGCRTVSKVHALLEAFAARLGPYFEPPDQPWDDEPEILRIRTKPGYIFDDDFWDAWHYTFPDSVVCHVAYYGPERPEGGDRTKDAGVFELRWTLNGAARLAALKDRHRAADELSRLGQEIDT